nr:immunoglobulin light chain junction region [Macaca mulatta]MOX11278.1 immunoglobulin light chain junction region [Macaca mulatta]MOX12273.1 immunoglobulin light chain junction region [Macaca mulatta]MOX12430.1 immunoglobulin light chain junction region [Macaca mulatta]MOX12796.1 immunoglobulin light chain junction region [Macaca mulatta]
DYYCQSSDSSLSAAVF